MQYPRGAGYWFWKPYIIQHTLDTRDEGTVVVYADAGCTLRKSFAWDVLFKLMEKYDSIVFQYADQEYPEWAKWGSTSAKMKVWTKRDALVFLDEYLGAQEYREENQVLSGLMFYKGKNNSLLNEWKGLIEIHPDLLADPGKDELQRESSVYVAHRHDQSILCPLALREGHTLVLPETLERYSPDAPVWASRLRAANFFEGIRRLVPIYLRAWLGNDAVDYFKGVFRR